MERKGLIGIRKQVGVGSDNLLYTALSNSYLQGDNQMTKHTRLKREVAQTEASLKSFKEIRRGDN